jgi:hypothetical protein
MRLLAVLTACLALFVVAMATTACSLLSQLERVDFPIEPLIQGDLRPLFRSPMFWQQFPRCDHLGVLLHFGPAAVVMLLGALLLAVARRRPELPAPLWALLMLLVGIVPYGVGALALAGNLVAERTGPWLLWQLLGPAYAALLSLAWSWRGLCPRRTVRTHAIGVVAA